MVIEIKDYEKIEEKWARIWNEKKIFESDPNEKKKFFLTFPYPYMNGYLHLGHFYTLMRVEAFARYKRLKGFNVLFPQAWHCTGSPIINAAQRIAEREEKQWKIMRDMGFRDEEIEQFADPKKWVEFFPKEAKKDYTTLGISVDFRRSFITTSLNPYYNKFIQWQFRKLKEKGYVIRGKHPVVWCPKCNTPVSDHARVEGEGERPELFVLLKFRLLCDIKDKIRLDNILDTNDLDTNDLDSNDLDSDDLGNKIIKNKKNNTNDNNTNEILKNNTYLLAATLRPETVFGQTNLWVGDIEYVLALVDENNQKEIWIITKECAEKLKLQSHNITIIATIDGKDLVGMFVLAPGIEKEIPILPSFFCNPKKGTGIVTSVPSDAPDDYIGLRDLKQDEKLCRKYNLDINWIKNINPIPIIDSGELGTLAAKKVVEDMKIDNQKQRSKLEQAKKLVYKHGYYKGRMLKNIPKYGGLEVEKAKELVKKDLIEQNKALLFYELINPVVCRCLTQSVVKIVSDQWFIKYSDKGWKEITKKAFENITLYPEEIRQQFMNVIDWLDDWACTREFGLGTNLPWDDKWLIESLSDSTIYMAYYTISHLLEKIDINKVNDELFDYIFLNNDSNREKLESNIKNLKELRNQFEYFYPLDFRNSGKDLIQNHLTFFVFNHTAIFDKKYWPKAIAVNGWITIDGKKMSKSLGNFILLKNLVKKYGVDASRFTVLNGGEGLDDANWDSEFASSIKTKLIKFANFVVEHYNPKFSNDLSSIDYNNLTFIDRWVLHHINKKIYEIEQHMEKTMFRSALQKIFFDLYPKIEYYTKRSNKFNNSILNYVLESLVIMLSPFTPFICEEIWNSIGNTNIAFASYPKSFNKFIDDKYEYSETLINNIINDINEVIKLLERKKITKENISYLKVITASKWKYDLINKITSLKNQRKDFREIMKEIISSEEFHKYKSFLGKNLAKIINKLPIVLENEYEIISQSLDYIKSRTQLNIILEKEEDSSEKKALQSMPFKPTIVVIEK